MVSALGWPIGVGIGSWPAFRFIRWATEFLCARFDARSDRVDERERRLEARYDARLAHLERELNRTRKAMMLLINDTAQTNPTNPVLQRVAELLSVDDNIDGPTRPVNQSNDALERLIKEADSVAPEYRNPRRD